jgi:hypothetical protein
MNQAKKSLLDISNKYLEIFSEMKKEIDENIVNNENFSSLIEEFKDFEKEEQEEKLKASLPAGFIERLELSGIISSTYHTISGLLLLEGVVPSSKNKKKSIIQCYGELCLLASKVKTKEPLDMGGFLPFLDSLYSHLISKTNPYQNKPFMDSSISKEVFKKKILCALLKDTKGTLEVKSKALVQVHKLISTLDLAVEKKETIDSINSLFNINFHEDTLESISLLGDSLAKN